MDVEDTRIRATAGTSQTAHIRALKDFTAVLGRAPDKATQDELRACEVTNLKVHDITRDRILIHVERCIGQNGWSSFTI